MPYSKGVILLLNSEALMVMEMIVKTETVIEIVVVGKLLENER